MTMSLTNRLLPLLSLNAILIVTVLPSITSTRFRVSQNENVSRSLRAVPKKQSFERKKNCKGGLWGGGGLKIGSVATECDLPFRKLPSVSGTRIVPGNEKFHPVFIISTLSFSFQYRVADSVRFRFPAINGARRRRRSGRVHFPRTRPTPCSLPPCLRTEKKTRKEKKNVSLTTGISLCTSFTSTLKLSNNIILTKCITVRRGTRRLDSFAEDVHFRRQRFFFTFFF